MSLADLLGIKEVPKEKAEEKWKKPSIDPFQFVTAIQQTDEDLIVDDWSEKQYNPYIVNRAMSMGADTVIAANEMNSRPHLSKKMQFDFLRTFTRKRKRYNKWAKADPKDENLQMVQEYYGYNVAKARTALRILTQEDLEYIRDRLRKGGTSDE
jgi:hypothetical protein